MSDKVKQAELEYVPVRTEATFLGRKVAVIGYDFNYDRELLGAVVTHLTDKGLVEYQVPKRLLHLIRT